ncbi:MAG TPA: hypothetical protein VKF40_28550 [Burkholderiales bacterium]|nr:hypothetical protein [Burkholderiales bacterium]
MTSPMRSCVAVALALAVAGAYAASAPEQSKSTRIVCWKDKSGKVVGCGDKVPPEYQESATKEMDRRGVTRATTESSEDAAKRRTQEQETAKQRAEDQKRVAEQKRQDTALLSTFSSEGEIDQKRDRDLQQSDILLGQMKVSLKNATDRYNEVKVRTDAAAKDKKGVPDALKEELSKADSDRQRLEQSVASKEKEKEEIKARYAEQKKRWLELRGESQAGKAAPSSASSGK